MNFFLSTSLALSYKILVWCVFLFIELKIFSNVPCDFSLTHGLFKSVLFPYITFIRITGLFRSELLNFQAFSYLAINRKISIRFLI